MEIFDAESLVTSYMTGAETSEVRLRGQRDRIILDDNTVLYVGASNILEQEEVVTTFKILRFIQLKALLLRIKLSLDCKS
jgi:hypothetical protein